MKYAMTLLPLALAACGSKPTVSAENASVAEVAEKVQAAGAGGMQLSPGRWESTVTIDGIDIPDIPPEMVANMKKVAADRTVTSCLTPEQAKKPAAEFFGGKDRKDCRYDRFTMGGGQLDAKLTCEGGDGKATVTMKGTYAPETYRVAMTTDAGSAQSPHGPMSIAATVNAKRAGACKGDEG